MRLFAALVLAALVPPALVAGRGGADLDLPFALRVSWYGPLAFILALAGAAAAALLDPGRGSARRALRALALVSFALVALVAWSGGVRAPGFRVTSPLRPALVGLGALALAALAGRPRVAAGAWRELVAGLSVGALAAGAALALDARELAARVATPRMPKLVPSTPRDVIFVLVDTLRADALGAYGAAPSPSPVVDGLAAEGALFERAFAQASWTFPSVAALFSSRHPSRLGLLAPPDTQRGDALPVIPAGTPLLAERLREAGFHTASFYKNPFLTAGSGFERGVDVHEHVGGDDADGHSGGQLVGAALRWARALAAARAAGDRAPFFLYLHFMEPHVDYQPPAAFVPAEARAYRGLQDGSAKKLHRARRAGNAFSPEDTAFLKAMYRGEVAYLDGEIARLQRELTRLGLWGDDTLFVLTADHGEQFGEHGDWEHGDMHVENVHVPLVFRGAGLVPRRIAGVVRLLDVAPTLLALEGLPALAGGEGRSLVPLLEGATLPPAFAVSELAWRWRVTGDPFSLILERERAQLFDLRADPRERHDLAQERPDTVAELRGFLDAHLAAGAGAAPGAPAARGLDDALRERLRALGYGE